MFTLPLTRCQNITPRLIGHRWMSVRPKDIRPADGTIPRKKVTIQTLHNLLASRTPITVLTAYDYPTALVASHSGVDVTLIGDSLAQVALGLSSTTELTLDMMVHHCAAVTRGTTSPMLIADMPFGTCQVSDGDTVKNAVRLIREGGVEGVKLEGGAEIVSRIRALTSIGIPVLSHVGLLPQRQAAMSGYRIQGRTAQDAKKVLDDARSVQDAGAFGVVLEGIPWKLASHITSKLDIPTIGIGAGPGTNGQVLVYDDALGRFQGHKAKFVRQFAHVRKAEHEGVKGYIHAVREGNFPSVAVESYEMVEGEWEKFIEQEGIVEYVHENGNGTEEHVY